jgi:hypothetical protein
VHGRDWGVAQPEGVHAVFAKGLPREKALDGDTLLAWAMNGTPLPAEHGGPVRLLVPGWYGIWWVKWITRIELRNEEFRGFWQHERYTYQDEGGRITGVVTGHLPRAAILSPRDGEEVHTGAPIHGLAWAGEHRVVSVETSVDDGETWHAAEFIESAHRWGWSEWRAVLPDGLPRGVWRISARAHDAAGRTQDWEPAFNRLGYGNNGIHRISVDVVADRPRLQRDSEAHGSDASALSDRQSNRSSGQEQPHV